MLISRYDYLERLSFNHFVFAVSFIVFCVLVGHWDMWSASYVDDIIKNVIDPCAFILILNVCKKYESARIADVICLWGKYSLEIYVGHWCMLKLYGFDHIPSIPMINFNNIWLVFIACFVALPIVYGCILFARIIETSSIVRLFFYGRTH